MNRLNINNFKGDLKVKKLLKRVAALSLCACLSTSFLPVSATMDDSSNKDIVITLNVISGNPFSELLRQVEPLVESNFTAHPELRHICNTKILEFQRLSAHLTDNDKRAVLNVFRTNIVETVSMRLRGYSRDYIFSCIRAGINQILRTADHFQEACNLLHFFVDSNRLFNSYPTIKEYYRYRCLSMLFS